MLISIVDIFVFPLQLVLKINFYIKNENKSVTNKILCQKQHEVVHRIKSTFIDDNFSTSIFCDIPKKYININILIVNAIILDI